jgi:hypothetical protein
MSNRKHLQSIEGDPTPADIFQPHLMGVEVFEDMDEVFLEARHMAAGQYPGSGDPEVDQVQRGVAILTPGRLIMLNGTVGTWQFTLTLTKNTAGKKQLRIER